jgi:hypothetical protein
MTRRSATVLLAVIAVLVVGGAGVFFLQLKHSADAAAETSANQAEGADANKLLAAPHVVFRSTALGNSYGHVAVVALADPAGPRAILDASCERVYATARAGVCVTADRGVASTYGVATLDPSMTMGTGTELAGLPSRARMSPDGSLLSTTTFVTGHSYAEASFSTSTIVRRYDGEVVGDIETFAASVDGAPFTAVDRNFWGVTFVDDDTFFVTGASTAAGTTWLFRGSLVSRTLTSLRTDVECPSVSPDGTKVAYKTRQGNPAPGQWKLAVLDLATGVQTVLPESRSVDDQAEWLDDDHVLYALSREGSEATTSDVWVMAADGSSAPQVFIPQASSPAVVR